MALDSPDTDDKIKGMTGSKGGGKTPKKSPKKMSGSKMSKGKC